MPRYNLVVMTNAVEGRDDAFNAWYSDVHIPDVLKIPGVVAAQRFRGAAVQRDGASPPFRYLAIYECDTDDLNAIVAQLKARSGTPDMPISDTLANERFVYFFEPITERRSA